jgi:hypothetical protein
MTATRKPQNRNAIADALAPHIPLIPYDAIAQMYRMIDHKTKASERPSPTLNSLKSLFIERMNNRRINRAQRLWSKTFEPVLAAGLINSYYPIPGALTRPDLNTVWTIFARQNQTQIVSIQNHIDGLATTRPLDDIFAMPEIKSANHALLQKTIEFLKRHSRDAKTRSNFISAFMHQREALLAKTYPTNSERPIITPIDESFLDTLTAAIELGHLLGKALAPLSKPAPRNDDTALKQQSAALAQNQLNLNIETNSLAQSEIHRTFAVLTALNVHRSDHVVAMLLKRDLMPDHTRPIREALICHYSAALEDLNSEIRQAIKTVRINDNFAELNPLPLRTAVNKLASAMASLTTARLLSSPTSLALNRSPYQKLSETLSHDALPAYLEQITHLLNEPVEHPADFDQLVEMTSILHRLNKLFTNTAAPIKALNSAIIEAVTQLTHYATIAQRNSPPFEDIEPAHRLNYLIRLQTLAHALDYSIAPRLNPLALGLQIAIKQRLDTEAPLTPDEYYLIAQYHLSLSKNQYNFQPTLLDIAHSFEKRRARETAVK